MLGQVVITSGVVTHVDSSGLFIEQAGTNASPGASRGLFIRDTKLAKAVRPGDRITVEGTVLELGDERDTLTALTDVRGFRLCASAQALPAARVELPLDLDQLEALEGMSLALNQSLVVSNSRDARDGLLTVSLNGMLPAPTEVSRPGPDAREQLARNRRSSMNIRVPDGEHQDIAVGTTVMGVGGVLGHDGRALRLIQTAPLNTVPVRIFRIDPPKGKDLRVLGLNLHNYFNGDGQGGGFPTPRGAQTAKEFAQQRQRLAATIEFIQPHVVAVMELENDGFKPGSAARDLIRDLEQATGQSWRVVAPQHGRIGEDQITVGIFYRADQVSQAGQPSFLNGPAFNRLSRQPMAQLFTHTASGESFVVVVNHLKSKGSCPEEGRNTNLRDGQGCWNQARTEAAEAMSRWARALADRTAAGRVLILGDMNAYRMEDPITAIIESGYKDLTAPAALQPSFSYVYSGEAGTLDYAFASTALMPFVQSARILHINSPYADDVELPLPFMRSSDHDPVVVDLRFLKNETFD